jgi:hypothetical protein
MSGTSYAQLGQGGGGGSGGVTSLNSETGAVVITSVDSSVVIAAVGQTIDLSVASASGDVAGPPSATANAIARFNGTTGKIIKNSTAVLDDSGNVGFAGTLVAGQLVDSGLTASTVPYTDSGKQFTSSAVTPTELGFVSGVTSSIQTQINGKQATGNYITALTGDVTASGPGSVASTLATVNASPGSFGDASHTVSATVNGKGLVTALSANAILIAESQVTNLVSDLAAKQATSSSTTPVSHQFLTGFTAPNTFAQAQPAFTDISGTVAASQLPNPTASTLGGVESIAAVSHNFLTSISTSGVPAQAQPAFTDISGTATIAQFTIATQAISASAIDWSTGSVFTKSITSTNTTFTFSNISSGQTIVVRITATTGTVTWPTVKWPGGTPPTQTVSGTDVYTFVNDGTNTYGSYVQAFA